MKIYNEVITQFNDLTGQWETLYEDSVDWNGPVAYAQGMPPNATAINTSDTIADTIKTTAGYFTNGDGTLSGNNVHTGSLANSNEKYYYNVTQAHPTSASAETQLSVTFLCSYGGGSDTYGDGVSDITLKGQTQAIYTQLSNLLLEETEVSGGFRISNQGAADDGTDQTRAAKRSDEDSNKDEYLYAIVGKRNRFKDRINKKAWTLSLLGRKSDDSGNELRLDLTDDSATVPAVATPGGPRYNIVSGALGMAATIATNRTFGWFYPEMGIMLFSGCELSASIPGPEGGVNITASFHADENVVGLAGGVSSNIYISSSGFAPNLDQHGYSANALRMVNCMNRMGSSTTLRLRSEEDQTQENYFCRIRATEYNFSANPTFTSGSKNKIRNLDMHGNPQTFITGCGLYNSAGQLLAIAKLSSPLKKNFASEATIKVKLTY